MNSAQTTTFTAGQRVRYAGMHGTTDGPIGKVWRVTRYGVWVTFPPEHGGRQLCHPEGLVAIGGAR